MKLTRRNAFFRIGVLAVLAVGSMAIPAWSGHDKDPPQTTISGAPSKRTTDKTPRFTFFADEKKSRFVCKRDGKRFAPCDSPKTIGPLAYGRHGFYVRAIDPFANRDATAAAYTFKVVRP